MDFDRGLLVAHFLEEWDASLGGHFWGLVDALFLIAEETIVVLSTHFGCGLVDLPILLDQLLSQVIQLLLAFGYFLCPEQHIVVALLQF